MQGAYQIATYLRRRLGMHHDVSYTPRAVSVNDTDPVTWAKAAPSYSFIIVCEGEGFENNVRPVELAP